MKGFNKVILMGNLTRDPETRTTPGGQSVTQFSLAVNRTWKGADGQQQEAVSFIDCVASVSYTHLTLPTNREV